jgi:hypothetical protein
MPIIEKANSSVNATAVSIGLAQMFTVTAASSNPAYLVLSALDRNEYTAGASGATGSLSGNGHTLGLSSIGSDARGAGIVFTYQASTGRYYNITYGYLDQLTYNSSGSAGDVTNLSLFGTASISQANTYASSAYSMMQVDAAGYLGSATVVTQARFTGTVPAAATPNSIVAAADGFIGQAWNMNGCWILASTIAADAGASLPVQSTLIGLAGQSNGEWIVAFNGPAGQSGNWQSMVTAGEMVVIGTQGGGGHITTCVAGTGSTAMLVDNITYVTSSGHIQNAANDGSASDVIVAAPHAASQEWAGVLASSVVIYELDTPLVTARVASGSLSFLSSQTLSALFTAIDPAGKAITQWQVYDTAVSDAIVFNGIGYQDHTASSALTASSLTAVSLLAGATLTTDMLEVRAYNGSYWGDWASLAVSVVATAAASPKPPVLAAQTAAQTWLGGRAVALALPAGTFTDPQGQKLTYSAGLSNGTALPSWLTFNAVTETFSGTAPAAAQSLGIVVTAKDTGGLSATDTFSVSVVGPPVVAMATANQIWTAGKAISLVLPGGTFTDPQGQRLVYTATQSNGSALPSWLTFNAATETFSGTTPATAQTLGITVNATDSSGLSSPESFTVSIQTPAPVVKPGITLTAQTPKQAWIDGQAVNLVLPSNTFTDASGLKMTFAAYEISGPNVTSWLRFNTATDAFSGNVPVTAAGTVQLEVIATDAQHMIVTDLFSVTFAPATGHATSPAGAVSLFNPGQGTGLLAFHA